MLPKQLVGAPARGAAFLFVSCSLIAVLAADRGFADELVPSTDKQGRTIISHIPWTPPESKAEPKVIYGTDDRIDVYEETDPNRLGWAASTCGLLDAADLSDNGNGTYTINASAYTYGGSIPACPGEPFASQPTAMWCSGFLVGSDIIATAGHCYSTSDMTAGVRFVFGFQMENASTPVLVVSEDQVYYGVEVLGRELTGTHDYTIVRVDRPVVSPGAIPLEIRREGTVPNDTAIGVIGHPSGLPMKLAFGSATKVYDNSPAGFFEANLDTYGGNSGSPVFNAATGIVEGILVRGNVDFRSNGSCFVSNELSDASAGEEVSKSTTFADFVPQVNGTPVTDRLFYACGSTMSIYVQDLTIAPGGTVPVTVTTEGGDSEVVLLSDTLNVNRFQGTLAIGTPGGAITPGNDLLEGTSTDTISITYIYGETVKTVQAALDCVPPVISEVAASNIGVESARISFKTSEAATALVEVGSDCLSFPVTRTGASTTSHQLEISGLTAGTPYRFRVTATDAAGNSRTLAGPYEECYYFRTGKYGATEFSANFDSGLPTGWSQTSVASSDTWTIAASGYAHSSPLVIQFVPSADSLRDARLISPVFSGDAVLEFYHTYAFESTYDGGIIEITLDGGTTWQQLDQEIVSGGYNSVIDSGFSSPISGKPAWSGGYFGPMTPVKVNLAGFPPGDKRIAFRFTADLYSLSGGWQVDDVLVTHVIPGSDTLSANDTWTYY